MTSCATATCGRSPSRSDPGNGSCWSIFRDRTAGRARGSAYRRYWAEVGERFPDLGGAASTRYYAENERRLLAEHLSPLSGLKILKSDLWDEARNTRILVWAAGQGAHAYGLEAVEETGILFMPGWLRMLDLACHAWCRPLAAITGALVWPFAYLDRRLPAVRRHGYLLATVARKPEREASVGQS